jgi:hypothetical protein
MSSRRRRSLAALLVFLAATPAHAQVVEITPFGGYRIGGGFYEIASGQGVDTDGAPSFGVIVNVKIDEDGHVEGLFTHQTASVRLPFSLDPTGTPLRVTVDQYQLGGLREFWPGRARPFLTGTLGLTRYESAGDNEIRFSFAAGGGVKLYPVPHIGARFEGRLFGTVVDASADVLACRPGVCVGSIDATFVWQVEFTGGLIVRF